jgi:PAS domain S-box-containing protein
MDRAPIDVEHAQLRAELAKALDRAQKAEARLDIRDRELAFVRASQEQLVSTLDATNDGIITLRADGSMYYNIRFVELWGIPEDRLTDLDRATLGEFQRARVKDPAAWSELVQRRRANLEDEDYSTVELKDGRVLERHVLPQRMGGKCVGSVVVFRDITERQRYEEKLLFNSLVVEGSGPMF